MKLEITVGSSPKALLVNKSHYTVKQIIFMFNEVKEGRALAEVLREKNISQATFYA